MLFKVGGVSDPKQEEAETVKKSEISARLHRYYKGKIEVEPKCPVRSLDDFSIWYTPGVAGPSVEISENSDLSYEYTNRGNLIAIVSDGSRVLGLGKIGPQAALPVMEGKALLYKYLGGVDAYPIVLSTESAEDLVKTVIFLSPSFGGINLEDIEAPKCFTVLDRLRNQAPIPVWHDDQQGTATVIMAALKNALKLTSRSLKNSKIALIGAGAASVATARLLFLSGLPKESLIVCDSAGILHPERDDLDRLQLKNPWKYSLAIETNGERRKGGIREALVNTDVCISAAASGPGVIKPEWVAEMNRPSIIFALANPIPEIWPREAKSSGAAIVATGRSDFPNQVNNSLVFPAVFRGTLDVMARSITDEMCLAAADALADYAQVKGLSEDHILPTMDEWEVYTLEAAAVGSKAIAQGLARVNKTEQELREGAYEKILAARKKVELLMKEGLIAATPR